MLGFNDGSMMQVAATYNAANGDTETAKAQMAFAAAQRAGDGASAEQRAAAADASAYLQERNKLQGQFTVDDKSKGPQNGNVVSTAELSKMARTMTNIDSGHSDIDVHAQTSPDATDEWNQREAAIKAQKEADLEKLLQTGAGRQLIYKLSNNVNQVSGNHEKTTLEGSRDPDTRARAVAAGPETETLGTGRGGTGTNADAIYQTGNDHQLFAALTQTLHMTQGAQQQGQLGDHYGGTEYNADAQWWVGRSDGKVRKQDVGMDREQAAIQGVAGYGSQLNGEKITVNQYEQEARANAARQK